MKKITLEGHLAVGYTYMGIRQYPFWGHHVVLEDKLQPFDGEYVKITIQVKKKNEKKKSKE